MNCTIYPEKHTKFRYYRLIVRTFELFIKCEIELADILCGSRARRARHVWDWFSSSRLSFLQWARGGPGVTRAHVCNAETRGLVIMSGHSLALNDRQEIIMWEEHYLNLRIILHKCDDGQEPTGGQWGHQSHHTWGWVPGDGVKYILGISNKISARALVNL